MSVSGYINGVPVPLKRKMSYQQIVQLAFPGTTREIWTIVYKYPKAQGAGCLLPGQRISIREGTSFTVCDTNCA